MTQLISKQSSTELTFLALVADLRQIFPIGDMAEHRAESAIRSMLVAWYPITEEYTEGYGHGKGQDVEDAFLGQAIVTFSELFLDAAQKAAGKVESNQLLLGIQVFLRLEDFCGVGSTTKCDYLVEVFYRAHPERDLDLWDWLQDNYPNVWALQRRHSWGQNYRSCRDFLADQ